MPRVLIIAYGNPLRSDDGVAWRAADALEGKFPAAEIEILRLHQLAPELAESVSRFEAVIFVDAAEGKGKPGEVRCEEVSPSAGKTSFSHQLSPSAVLDMAKGLFGASPRAFSVTLTGESFDHGEALSPVVVAALPALIARIAILAQQFLSSK
jgi:hydrogenase maturation protease